MTVTIYFTRHGKTRFNAIGRAQGWSDSPLTKEGEEGIVELGLGFKEQGISFDRAYSSDTGRTFQTTNLILKYSENEGIPYKQDWRIREWSFGSFDGDYDSNLFEGVMPHIFAEEGLNNQEPTLKQMNEAIYEADSAGWAETWAELTGRILGSMTEFADLSAKVGEKNILVVSHGMTISTFVNLLNPDKPRPRGLENGSVTKLTYENGTFTVEKIGDMSYRQAGHRILGSH